MPDFAEFIETLGETPAPPAKHAPRTEFRLHIETMRSLLVDAGILHDAHPVAGLDGDELDIVGVVIERLKLGRGVYGQWVASADLRDHDAETLDEMVDGGIYQAMRALIRRRRS